MFGVFFSFLLAVISAVCSALMFRMEAEPWVSWMFVVFTPLLLMYALVKLDGETDLFSNAMQKKRVEKAKKISYGQHETRPINMVPMFIRAYEERKEFGKDDIQSKAVRYISSTCKKLEKSWKLVYDETTDIRKIGKRENVKITIVKVVETMLAAFGQWGDSLHDCYTTYRRVCKKIGHTPITEQEFSALGKSSIEENEGEMLVERVSFFLNTTRRCIPSAYYEKFVQAFCYMSLYNGSVYQEEYNMIKFYFFQDSKKDVYPKTWEQFKKEY